MLWTPKEELERDHNYNCCWKESLQERQGFLVTEFVFCLQLGRGHLLPNSWCSAVCQIKRIMLTKSWCLGWCWAGLTLSQGLSVSHVLPVSRCTGSQKGGWPGQETQTQKGYSTPQSVMAVALGEAGQDTAQGWAGCWAVGRQQFHWESLDFLGFYFPLSFAC